MAKTGGHAREAKRARVLQALKAGNTRKASYQYAGVPESTFFDWMADPSFSEFVAQAEAQAEVTCATSVVRSASKDWRAAIEWLKRRRGADWREISSQEISGPNGGPIETYDHSAELDGKLLGVIARIRGQGVVRELDSG